MGLLRCFIAIELTSAAQKAIEAATAGLRSKLGKDLIRWVPTANMHLTLKFLGDTAPSGLEMIQAAMRVQAPRYTPFDLVIEGFGAFPSERRPKVLWVGLTAPPELASLQRELDSATDRLGYRSDARGFSPHLTIGRVREQQTAAGMLTIRDGLENASVGRIASIRVSEIHLFSSELLPSGSRYTQLFTVPLGAA